MAEAADFSQLEGLIQLHDWRNATLSLLSQTSIASALVSDWPNLTLVASACHREAVVAPQGRK